MSSAQPDPTQSASSQTLSTQPPPPSRQFRYFDLILGLFAVVLIISNIASTKTAVANLGRG